MQLRVSLPEGACAVTKVALVRRRQLFAAFWVNKRGWLAPNAATT